MDISSITANTREVAIRHPSTEEPVGLYITLRAMTDPEVEKVRRAQANRRLGSRNNKITAEQMEANAVELLMSAIVGWRWEGDLQLEGEQPPYSEAAARKLLKYPWIRRQVDTELGDEASFYEG